MLRASLSSVRPSFATLHSSVLRSSIAVPRATFTTTQPLFEGRTPAPLKDTSGVFSKEKTVGNVNYHPDFLHAWTPELFKKSVAGLAVVSGLSCFLHPVLGLGLGGCPTA